MTKQQRKILIKIIIGAVLFAVGMVVTHLLTLPWWAELLIFLAVYLVPGFSVLEKAVRNIAHGQVFDENFLMTIASIAAFAIGQYPEAVEVILFYQVGELFEKIAVGRSRQAVSDLLDLCPDEATVLRDGKPETVLVDEVEVGEHILVRPGEKSRWTLLFLRDTPPLIRRLSPVNPCRSVRQRVTQFAVAVSI